MNATIYDVAEAAGVSIATVSYVINGKRKVSDKTKAKVLDAMEKLDYRPSVLASALMGKQTYSIGMMVPDISNPFFAEISRAVEDECRLAGYSLILCSTDHQKDRIGQYLHFLQQKSVDGIILATGILDGSSLDGILAKGTAVVQLAREIPGVPAHAILADDREGGRMAAKHLLSLGHRNAAVLAEDARITSSKERVQGFAEAWTDADLRLDPDRILPCTGGLEDARQQAVQLLSSRNRPSALFACNDLLAISAIQAARELNLSVPEDVSVVSFDNTLLASVSFPGLTAVAQPIAHMGKLAVRTLLQEMKGEGAGVQQRIVLRPELVIRSSTSTAVQEQHT
ncbi:LacI family DNA-binding transcriptional regulator [Gorillibacterium sp. sgz5001074]|uniref:LacI family DNA-binding transcriptional regulator n=1 Tax=Gorillibacterium sp. sgz5001074 TaxID=3446695 RepID=UPI003F6699EC